LPPSPGPSDRTPNLKAIRRKDTKPERQVRSALHGQGLRFRVDHPLRVDGYPRLIRPDVVFTRARLAVFVDGCWWHGCPAHGARETLRNEHYWRPKIALNQERDVRQNEALTHAGWTVLRVWEHEDPAAAAEAIRLRLTELYAAASSGKTSWPSRCSAK
jgi:DNA mismatch endonuclease (patch repair protein)